MLQAMGNIGNDLLSLDIRSWRKVLKNLKQIDWSRENKDWDGRALNHGRINKSRVSVILSGNYIKENLGVELNELELKVEEEYV